MMRQAANRFVLAGLFVTFLKDVEQSKLSQETKDEDGRDGKME